MPKSIRTKYSRPAQPVDSAADRTVAQAGLDTAAMEARCAAATTASERRRWQVLMLLSGGLAIDEVVAATGYRRRTVRELWQRFLRLGPAALSDRRAESPGAAPLLSREQLAELRHALRCPPAEGGTWTGPRVARWITERTGRPVHRQRGWEYLRRCLDEPDVTSERS